MIPAEVKRARSAVGATNTTASATRRSSGTGLGLRERVYDFVSCSIQRDKVCGRWKWLAHTQSALQHAVLVVRPLRFGDVAWPCAPPIISGGQRRAHPNASVPQPTPIAVCLCCNHQLVGGKKPQQYKDEALACWMDLSHLSDQIMT